MKFGLLTMLGLAGVLLAVPAPAPAGNYGCQSGYYSPGCGVHSYYPASYYPASYYTPTYSYTPAVVTPAPNTCVDTPAGTVCNHGYGVGAAGLAGGYGADYRNDVLYRIAPDLAQARLAQEAANAAIVGLKAELAKQQAEAEAKADRQANRDFQQQVIQLLAQRGGPTAPTYPQPAATPALDPQVLQAITALQQENAQLRAALERAAAPPAAAPPRLDAPPAIPAAGGPPNPKADGGLAEAARRAVADKGHGCLECHGPNNPKKLTDLSDPSKLYYEKLADCANRMISSDPDFVMPKGKKPGTVPAEVVGIFHDLSRKAPHDPRLKQ